MMKETKENNENLFGDIKKGQPFQVPEGYFETFADRLKVRMAEEDYTDKKRTLFFHLKPFLKIAASLAIAVLLVYAPYKKFKSSDIVYSTNQQLNSDSNNPIPIGLFSYYSDDQFIAAVTDMDETDSKTLSSENLADYISANYDDYEIFANN